VNKTDLLNLGRRVAQQPAEPAPPEPTDVDVAARLVVELQAKRTAAVDRVTAIAEERKSVALAAHTGDTAARKRLDALNLESTTIGAEIEGLDAAIAEAGDRLATAEAAEALEADRARARELRHALAEFTEHGRKLDEAMAAVVAESNALRTALHKMHSLGCEYPTDALALVNCRLAIGTALMQTPWKREFEHLAPGQRRTFGEIIRGWVERIEPTIARRLGETQDEAA
jgi:chromosome segregation ATPase